MPCELLGAVASSCKSVRVKQQPAEDDFWNKWQDVYDHVTSDVVVRYDHVTLGVVVNHNVATTPTNDSKLLLTYLVITLKLNIFNN